MSDKIGKWMFRILIPVLLFIGFTEYLHSAKGMELFGALIGSYPFAAQIVKIIKSVTGFQDTIPVITAAGFSFDITRLLISALIKSSVVSALLRIFCGIPVFDEAQLRRAGMDQIDAAEKYMSGTWYQFKALLVNAATSLIIVFISNEILKRIYEYMESYLSTAILIVSSIGSMICAMLAYTLIFRRCAEITLGVSLLWVIFGKIFPKVLDVFGLNVLCLCFYISIYTEGFSTSSAGIGIMLILWCACADVVNRSLAKMVTGKRGDEGRIRQLEEKIRNIEDALEETDSLAKRISSGLIPNIINDEDRLDELRKGKTIAAVKRFGSVEDNSRDVPVSQPVSVQPSANALFQGQLRRAEMELKDQNWKQALRLYDKVLDMEPENAQANLGMFMVNRKISEKKQIPEAARNAMKSGQDIFADRYYKRTLRYAAAETQNELESYQKGRDYLIAVEALQRSKTDSDFRDAEDRFAKLGDFADAKKQQKEAVYRRAVCMFQKAQKADEYLAACRLFESLGDYSDSKNKKESCEEKYESIQQHDHACRDYRRAWIKFEAEFENAEEIRSYSSNIKEWINERNKLKWKNDREYLGIKWAIGSGLIGLVAYMLPMIGEWLSDLTKLEKIYPFLGGGLGIVVIILVSAFLGDIVEHIFLVSMVIATVIGTIFLVVFHELRMGILYVCLNYSANIEKVAKAGIILAFILIVKKTVRAVSVKEREAKIKRLTNDINAEFNKAGTAVISEYQKIYNQYKEAGSERKTVQDVQVQLMACFKEHLGWTE